MSGSGDPTLPKKNSPDPKLFFSFEYKTILVRFFTHKNVFKHSCEHSKIKQNLIILTSVLKLICCLDKGRVYFEKSNILYVSIIWFWNIGYSIVLFLFVSRCVRWSAGYFLEQSCWLLYNELWNLEPFDLETVVAQYKFQMKQDRTKTHINCL